MATGGGGIAAEQVATGGPHTLSVLLQNYRQPNGPEARGRPTAVVAAGRDGPLAVVAERAGVAGVPAPRRVCAAARLVAGRAGQATTQHDAVRILSSPSGGRRAGCCRGA